MLDETGNGHCLTPHSYFHVFSFPPVRDVFVFQETSREQATWTVSGKTEEGGKGAHGSRTAAGRQIRNQRPGDGLSKWGIQGPTSDGSNGKGRWIQAPEGDKKLGADENRGEED